MKAYTKALTIISIVLAILFVAQTANAASIPVTIDEVHVNSREITQDQVTLLSVLRNNQLDITIDFTAERDAEDLEIHAYISGYKNNDIADERIETYSDVFKIQKNIQYQKTLTLTLPSDIPTEDYLLRLVFTNARDNELRTQYKLKIDTLTNDISVQDIFFHPGNSITAGQAITSSILIKNTGADTQDNIKVTLSIPALDIQDTARLTLLEHDEEEETTELYLPTPKTAAPGTYPVELTITYRDGYKTLTITAGTITIKGTTLTASTASTPQEETVRPGNLITYPVTIHNTGNERKSYTVSVTGADDWATITYAPTNTVIVDAGETRIISALLKANEDATTSKKVFMITTTSRGEKIQETTATANVVASDINGLRTKNALEILLVILVTIVIIVGIIVVIAKLRNNTTATSTYY